MLTPKLTEAELQYALKDLPDWEFRDGKIFAKYRFSDFSEAWAFMCRCALMAEKLDHHPDWKNVYNTVEIELWTHDSGGITDMDIKLAAAISKFASKKN